MLQEPRRRLACHLPHPSQGTGQPDGRQGAGPKGRMTWAGGGASTVSPPGQNGGIGRRSHVIAAVDTGLSVCPIPSVQSLTLPRTSSYQPLSFSPVRLAGSTRSAVSIRFRSTSSRQIPQIHSSINALPVRRIYQSSVNRICFCRHIWLNSATFHIPSNSPKVL